LELGILPNQNERKNILCLCKKRLKEENIMGEKGFNHGSGFALIVVLFILLIIVGAAWCC
jgi:uncharacterized protein (TIGR01732 family)